MDLLNDLNLSYGAAFIDNTQNWGDANQTLSIHDRRVCFTTAISAARTVALPTITSAAGRSFLVQDAAGGASLTNTITLVPNGTDKINGVNANFLAVNNAFAHCLLWASLSANEWIAVPVGYNPSQYWAAHGTYTYPIPPANCFTTLKYIIHGGGGGGASGGMAAAAAIAYGGGGACGGSTLEMEWPIAVFAAKGDTSLTVTVGQGGAGGAALTAAGTGNTGTAGGFTKIVGTQSAFVYGYATGGTAGAGGTGSAGGGGTPAGNLLYGFGASSGYAGSGASTTGVAGVAGTAIAGNDARAGLPGGASGGGSGGGVTAANAVSNGGNGGGGHGWQGTANGYAAGGAGSTTANGGVGGTPTAPPAQMPYAGDAGAGGGSCTFAGGSAGTGGSGVGNGGGGGGGGAAQGSATHSGAGGPGADGGAYFSAS